MGLVIQCRHKGCNRKAQENGYCSKHQGDVITWNLQPSKVSYQDSRWRTISKELREAHPYCDKCGKYFSPSDLIVHHKEKKAKDIEGTEEFYNIDNLEVLCRRCHYNTIIRGE